MPCLLQHQKPEPMLLNNPKSAKQILKGTGTNSFNILCAVKYEPVFLAKTCEENIWSAKTM